MNSPWMAMGQNSAMPRTQNLPRMQQLEMQIEQMKGQQNDLKLRQNVAQYKSNKINNQITMAQKLMEMLKGGSGGAS